MLDSSRIRSASLTMESLHPYSALLVSWDEGDSAVEPFGALLEERFGYHLTPLKIPAENPQRVLKEYLDNALSTHSGKDNPFILYLHGSSSAKSAQSRLLLTGSNKTAPVDWLQLRQQCLDKYGYNVFTILDCEHEVVESDSVVKYPILKDDVGSEPKSILEILVAPKDVRQDVASFADILTATLRRMIRSSASDVINIKSLEGKLARLDELTDPAVLYSLRPDQKDLQLKICAPDEHNGYGELSLDPSSTNNMPEYSSVSVLPITWAKVDGWDANAELDDLIKAFEKHFEFNIEKTVKIPNNNGASAFLHARIDQQIVKAEAGKNNLLVVIYNGHADRRGGGMYLFGEHEGDHEVNWTEFTHKLNIAHCDVVFVLDCCYSLSATKGRQTEKQEQLITAANSKTRDQDYYGRNETLAAGGRGEKVPAGKKASMPVFTAVLKEMAKKKSAISIGEWQQHIIEKIDFLQEEAGDVRYAEPIHKMNPILLKSIELPVGPRR